MRRMFGGLAWSVFFLKEDVYEHGEPLNWMRGS
jgi:hypothetical protein